MNVRPRIIQHVHASPGRLRLRLPWLRESIEESRALAEALADLAPTMDVQIRPWTGSVLCCYSPDEVDGEDILQVVRSHTGVDITVRPGEQSPEAQAEYERAAAAGVGTLTTSLADGMRSLNGEVMRATDGRLDLGALTGLGFLGLGAAEIATTRSVPAPPWFNLAWYAFRTFTIFRPEEGEEGDASDASDGAGLADAAPPPDEFVS